MSRRRNAISHGGAMWASPPTKGQAGLPYNERRGRRPRRPPRPQARNLPFLLPAGDFCQQRQKSPKTPLETAFQDFLTRVGYDFALTRPTRNRFSGFFRFKGLCLHSFPRCAVARRCPLPRWVPWCSTARVPADIPSRRTTLSAPHDRCTPYTSRRVDAGRAEKIPPAVFS